MKQRVVSSSDRQPICAVFGKVVREERSRLDLTLSALAQLTGLSRQCISAVEKGRKVPNLDTVARLAGAFGVDPATLLIRARRRLRSRA